MEASERELAQKDTEKQFLDGMMKALQLKINHLI
jgi:hypothetical protein